MSLTGKTNGPDSTAQSNIPTADIWAEFGSIAASSSFASSDRLTRFLRFIIEEALAGRADQLKEFAIALEVFDRDETFDPQTNTIVRVQAGRLRRRLERYYLTDGTADAIRIDIPKGGYAPVFEHRPQTNGPSGGAVPRTSVSVEATSVANLDRPRRTRPSISVLPFECYSSDTDDQFFADGITEETIANLARFKDLFVFSRSTTAKLVHDGADIRQLREELGVDFVLEGSIRKSLQLIRVAAQLIDTATGGCIFAEQFERPCTPEGVFEIQDEIALLVAGRVASRHGPLGRYVGRAKRSGQAQHWETYHWITRFYDYYATHNTDAHFEVREGLVRALERDTDSSDGWAALSIILLDEYRLHINERPNYPALDRALEHALRAVTCDPENAFAFQSVALAYFHRREFTEFKFAAERAIELNPGHADVLADMGLCYVNSGNLDRGIELVDRAIELSPVHPGWYRWPRAWHQLRNGNVQAAVMEMKAAPMPGYFWHHAHLARLYAELADYKKAADEISKLLSVYPDFAANARRELEIWCTPEKVVEKVIDSWRAAGLKIE